MHNAMIIDSKDNVAVAIEPIAKGDTVTYLCDGQDVSLTAQQDITIYHKLATRDIAKGEPVVKYGEHIGIASQDIKAGAHVHEHNVEGHREDLEAKA
jgi:altronate dehydratase small subunit